VPVAVKVKAKPLGTLRPPARDLDLAQVNVLGDRGLVAELKRSTTSAELTMTIEGASTLTLKVRDYSRSLLRSPIARTRARLLLDGIEYMLVKVGHEGNEITLIFEETAVNLLRRYRKPRKANRANTNRAQFIEGMVREVTERAIPFSCPELKDRQTILKPDIPVTPERPPS
jgi:hypothetical protein